MICFVLYYVKWTCTVYSLLQILSCAVLRIAIREWRFQFCSMRTSNQWRRTWSDKCLCVGFMLVLKGHAWQSLHLHIPFFRCVILTNVCVYVPSNTTTILYGVYLLALSNMFRPLLGHHQAFWRYVFFVHCFYIILHLHLYYLLHYYKRSLILVL
jgi:hypothetical protein